MVSALHDVMGKSLFLFFSGLLLIISASFAVAATFFQITNDPAIPPPYNQWAWNDVINWINLKESAAKKVEVSDDLVRGIATSGVGDIYFNAASYPGYPGSLPAGVTWSVLNDAAGNLSGYAWNDAIGWISFQCNAPCVTSNYRVTIDGGNGNFSGYAWNDVGGWISFWCGNNGASCSTPAIAYRTQTVWRLPVPVAGSLDSSIFDAGTSATFNSILWQGNLNGGAVQFRIASSNNAAGPWSFVGPGNNPAAVYSDLAGKTIPLTVADHSGKRYVRYRIFLTSAAGQSPRVNDVIINWSR